MKKNSISNLFLTCALFLIILPNQIKPVSFINTNIHPDSNAENQYHYKNGSVDLILPSFKAPYDRHVTVYWTGGPHSYHMGGKLTGTYTAGTGSGLDFAAGNFKVLAMAGGEVIESSCNDSRPLGCIIAIKHSIGGTVMVYAHLLTDSALVKKGDIVSVGQEIAKAGSTGTGAYDAINDVRVTHLHLDLRDGSDTCSAGVDCIASPRNLGGNPVPWDDGLPIFDGYTVKGYIKDYDDPFQRWNYEGSAIKGDLKLIEGFPFIDYPSGAHEHAGVFVNMSFFCDLSQASCEDNSINVNTIFAGSGANFPNEISAGGGSSDIFTDSPTLIQTNPIKQFGSLLSTNDAIYVTPELSNTSEDNSKFIDDISFPDGSIVYAGAPIGKIWRVKNIGNSSWNTQYKLVFISGEQMNAPSEVAIPAAAPGQEVDLSVSMTAPATLGNHAGTWRLRNPQGTYFGDPLWIRITVGTPDDGTTGEVVSVTDVSYPPVVSPNQTFRPSITVQLNQGQLLQTRGDMLRNTDGNLYNAWPHVLVSGSVSAGQSYTFTFYEDNPIKAPAAEGTYESKWRVWQNGAWVGPEITLRFDVKIGGGTRPSVPSMSSPGNWSHGASPTLCVNAASGVQYDFQIYESYQTPESGWIGSSCWTPSTLPAYNYQWHVKARNISDGLESDWSETWHFTVDSNQLSLADLEFSPGSPSSSESIRVYTCAGGFGGIGLGLKIEANTATDGSTSGDWYWIHHLGTFCYDHANTSTWPTWATLPLGDGDHLVRATAFGPDGQTLEKTAVYHLNRRRPNSPTLVNPTNGDWLNDQNVTFRWLPTERATGFRLQVSQNSDPTISPIIDQSFGPSVLEYATTFPTSYTNLYWKVSASNELGTSSTTNHFALDFTAPGSSVVAFNPTIGYESAFTVTWGGSDDRSGIRWYDLQVRDGNRADSEWLDWQTNTESISAIFIGQAGHTYYFRSRALDLAGNLEAWPGGDGDTHLSIDPAARPPEPWWNSAYAFKRNALILNNDTLPLVVGYPVHLHFDAGTSPSAAAMYAASLTTAKGNDFRIIYNNQTELPRYIESFTSSKIDIWFNLQEGIAANPASSANLYQLYYGNAAAGSPANNPDDVLPPPDDANTVGLWHFNNGTGTSITDTSSYANTGTLTNGSWAAGKFGGAAVFNGTSTYVSIPSASQYGLSNFTIEGWYKPGTQPTVALLYRRNTSGTENAYYLGTRDYRIEAGVAGRSLWGTATLTPGRWYHIAFTYNGATLKIYINGVLDSSKADSIGVPASTGALVLGRNSANSDYLSGQLQGWRISNTVRSAFSYGAFGLVLNEPSLAAGIEISQPVSGSVDLAITSVQAYPDPDGGVLIQVEVTNQGTKDTTNGFFTDLYLDHIPVGAGDFTGSLSFWVNDPIGAGDSIALTRRITNLSGMGGGLSAGVQTNPFNETTGTLYAQVDSTGVLVEPDDSNNIATDGVFICTADEDAFEEDDTFSTATFYEGIQTHNIGHIGDQDWVQFTAHAGKRYDIRTVDLSQSADTFLSLYAPDGTTLLASNDDMVDSVASRIDWIAPSDGLYYLEVHHWNPLAEGCGTGYRLVIHTAFFELPIIFR